MVAQQSPEVGKKEGNLRWVIEMSLIRTKYFLFNAISRPNCNAEFSKLPWLKFLLVLKAILNYIILQQMLDRTHWRNLLHDCDLWIISLASIKLIPNFLFCQKVNFYQWSNRTIVVWHSLSTESAEYCRHLFMEIVRLCNIKASFCVLQSKVMRMFSLA